MRHINQMTYEELNARISEVEALRLQARKDGDDIRWNELFYLGQKLKDEASKRAEVIGISATARRLGMIV